MGLTKKQAEKRRKGIGGSDVYKLYSGQAHQVWLSKVHSLDDKPAPWMADGTRMEPVILRWYQEVTGRKLRFVDDPDAVSEAIPVKGSVLAPIPDDLEVESGRPVEGKYVTLYAPQQEHWGDPGTDQVPLPVIYQGHAQMAATKADVCAVPTYIEGRGFCQYEITRDDELCEIIIRDANVFWEQYVIPKVPPGPEWDIEQAADALDTLKRIVRVPNKVLAVGVIDHKLVKRWEAAKSFVKTAEMLRDGLLAKILLPLGDGEAAELKDGRFFSYIPTARAGYTVKPGTLTTPRVVKTLPKLETK